MKTNGVSIKSTDVVITNWLDMTDDMINQYLSYDPLASLIDGVSIKQRQLKKPRVRLSTTFTAADGNHHLRLNLNNRKKSYLCKLAQVKDTIHNVSCISDRIDDFKKITFKNNIRVANDDLSIKIGLLFGCDTISPIVGSLLGMTNLKYCISPEFLDPIMERIIFGAIQDIQTLYSKFSCNENVFTFPMKRLRYIHAKLLAFNGKGFLHFLTCIIQFMSNLHSLKVENVPKMICQLLYRLELCFGHLTSSEKFLEDDIAHVSGHCFLAPPGTGKTQFTSALSLSIVDTDWLSPKIIDENPGILDRLMDSGFTLITNRWEYENLSHSVVCVKYTDVSRGLYFKKSADTSRFYLDKRQFLVNRYKDELRRCPSYKPIDISEWIRAYRNVESVCAVVSLDVGQTFIHGFGKVIDYYIQQVIVPVVGK